MAQPVLEFYDTNDVLVESLNFGSIQGGEYSDVIELRLWNDKGGADGSDEAQNVVVKVFNEDGEESGDLVENAWAEYKIGDAGDTATPAQSENWYSPLGLNFYATFEPIQSNTYRTMKLRLRAPLGLTTESLTFQITPAMGAVVIPITVLEREVIGNGVLREDGKNIGLRSGTITTDGSDTVTVSEIEVLLPELVTHEGGIFTFDQDDVNGDTLTSDELYYALLSLDADGNMTVTKGEKGTTPSVPDTPAGDLAIAIVTILFNDNGTEITNDEVQLLPSYLEFYGEEIIDTLFRVHSGRAVAGTNYLTLRSPVNVVLSEGINYIMLSPEGVLVVDDEEYDNHLMLYEITHTSGTNAITDRRNFLYNVYKDELRFVRSDDEFRTLHISDAWRMVERTSDDTQFLNIPTNSSVPFPIGTQILFSQKGEGTVVVTYASGVSTLPPGNHETIEKGSVGGLIKCKANQWYVFGDVEKSVEYIQVDGLMSTEGEIEKYTQMDGLIKMAGMVANVSVT